MPATRVSTSRLITALAKVFKSGDADGAMADLADALDIPTTDGDIGNAPHATPSARELAMGRPQRMDGAGAERMSAEFSNPERGDGLTQQYDELARRLGGLEQMTKALAGFVLAAAKATGAVDEHEEPKEDEEEKDEAAKAAGLPSLSLAQFFSNLTPRQVGSRGNGMLTPPPNLATVAKASVDIGDRIDNADLTFAESVAARETLQLLNAARAGHMPFSAYEKRLAASPFKVRDLFGAA